MSWPWPLDFIRALGLGWGEQPAGEPCPDSMLEGKGGGRVRPGSPASSAVAVRVHVIWQKVALQGRLQELRGQRMGRPGPVWGERLQFHPGQWQLQHPDGAI